MVQLPLLQTVFLVSEVLHRVFRARRRGRLASGQAELLDADLHLESGFHQYALSAKTTVLWKNLPLCLQCVPSLPSDVVRNLLLHGVVQRVQALL